MRTPFAKAAKGTMVRLARHLALALHLMAISAPAGFASELHIAAWNLEHLDDTEGDGCIGRSNSDYAALARRIEQLDADIVAIQEVENAMAAHRVFTVSEWHVEMSERPAKRQSRACWDRPEAQLGHLATGFAVRRGIEYRRNSDLRVLGVDDAFQRWGTDISITAGDRDVRLLSVHLKSGCWGEAQDRDEKRQKTCATLRGQIEHLKAWADARRSEGTAFVILGDFNRRLALPGDWGWSLLSPASASLHLVTAEEPFDCDPRFSEFIDHIAAGGGAETMLVKGSFREWPRREPHPDHCAISATFRLDP